MKFTIAALTALVASATAGPLILPRAESGDAPNPNEVWVESVSYGGTGCPQGSASVDIFADKKSFQILLQEYIASTGPGVKINESRKNCQVTVGFHYPGGFQYSVFSSDYRGYADIAKGDTGYQKANYYFSGETKQVSTETKIVGPYNDDYLLHDEIPFSSTVWSPCGRSSGLSINTSVRLDSKDKKRESILTTDSIDGKVTYQVGIQWQKCNKKA